MSPVKKIPVKDFMKFADIVVNAYPGMGMSSTPEDLKKMKERLARVEKDDPRIRHYGVYRRNQLLGGMRLYDFDMTLFDRAIPVGGVGLVAVDLNHKKEHVCKEMIEYFHQHYLKKGACMTTLYPFRPDFYRKMGYGYGVKLSHYRIKPADLPGGKAKKNIHYLSSKDFPAMTECYDRYAAATHGMMRRVNTEFAAFERRHFRMIGYKRGKKLLGYTAFSFKKLKQDNFILNDIVIEELIYENREAFLEMISFFHNQADQINAIIFDLLDDSFHFLPHDPRIGNDNIIAPVYHESNTQGVGLMYRVIDIKKLFTVLKNHDFGGQNLKLKLTVRDSLLPQNAGSYILHFADGKPSLKKKAATDVEIEIDIADFSSLIMGCVDFRSLYDYGLVEIGDEKYLDAVNRLFLVERKPICWSQF